MAKPRIVYPDTATRVEKPLLALVHRLDPEFAKEHRFDTAYVFGRRVFKEDSMLHGAYAGIAIQAEDGTDLTTGGGARISADIDLDGFLTRGLQDPPVEFDAEFDLSFERYPDPYHCAALIDGQFRRDNGFIDPIDDGTVTTGTGAGGANPGAVPSTSALKSEDGMFLQADTGKTLQPDPAPNLGVVFKGA